MLGRKRPLPPNTYSADRRVGAGATVTSSGRTDQVGHRDRLATLVGTGARGRVGGRPTVIMPEIIRAARDMLPNPDASVTAIARLLGVSPGTLYNHIPDLQELRAAGRARHQLPAASAEAS